MSLSFRENSKVNVPVESVAGVVSVKSRLDKAALYDALSGLATIPQIDPSALTLGPLVRPLAEYTRAWPSLFVFGFEGLELESLFAHVTRFYLENPVPLNRQPRAIIVNRRHILVQLHWAAGDGGPTVQWIKCTDASRGFPLFWLLAELGKAVTWLDGMSVSYGPYFAEAFPPETVDTNLSIRALLKASPEMLAMLASRTGLPPEMLMACFPNEPHEKAPESGRAKKGRRSRGEAGEPEQ